jgi:hypothetical protein
MTSPAQSGPRPPAPPPTAVEQTRWSLGLVGFYCGCAGTSLGAAIGFAGYKFFDSVAALVWGGLLCAASIVACFVGLSAARRKAPQ